jgi:hypothetical protein
MVSDLVFSPGARSSQFHAGESWRYQPDIHHTVGCLAVSAGERLVPDTVEAGELAIFEPSDDPHHYLCEGRYGFCSRFGSRQHTNEKLKQ